MQTQEEPSPAPQASPETVKPGLATWPHAMPVQTYGASQIAKADVPITPGACATDGAPIQIDLVTAAWERHPTEPYWVPSFTFAVCTHNPKGQWITPVVQLKGGSTFPMNLFADTVVLNGGDGWGPVKLILKKGLPDPVVRLMQQGLIPWPQIDLILKAGEREVTQPFPPPAGAEQYPGAYYFMPVRPSSEVLAAAAWDGPKLLNGTPYYLYSSQTSFEFDERGACGRAFNRFSAAAKDWQLYQLGADGAPKLISRLGEYAFRGGKGWSWEDRPQVGYAFLRLDFPGNCHVPDGSLLWALDHRTGQLHRPHLHTATQSVDAYAYEPLDEQGGFTLEDWYALEGPVTTLSVRWEPTDGNWYLEGSAPMQGPSGATESPDEVYSPRP